MGFIQYIPRRGRPLTSMVAIAHYKKSMVVHLRIAGDIANPFIEAGSANVFIGTAEKSGFIRIEPSAYGTQRCIERGQSVDICVRASSLGLKDKYFGMSGVPFSVDDDGITIDLRALIERREMLAAAE